MQPATLIFHAATELFVAMESPNLRVKVASVEHALKNRSSMGVNDNGLDAAGRVLAGGLPR